MNDVTPPATPPAPPAGVNEDGLRLVLFGMPEAGKSSLLGALGQATLTQEHLLGGRVIDQAGGLITLARTLYDEQGRRTAEQLVPYPVRYEPLDGPPLAAVLLDCDGRVASDMLVQKQVPDASADPGTLASEVAEADALLLVIDASATPEEVEADFAEFDRFLRTVEDARGEQTEVAGLPVFLVLTKCDLLAQATDSMADWMDRIEQRKRDVDARFRDFLSRRHGEGSQPGPVLAFGRIDLHVWATAVKRPGLLGALARPREPYGVAELFRQALAEAAAHRRRERRSSRQLAWLAAATAVLLLTLVSLTVALLVINHATATSALASRIDDLRYLDKETPAARLRGSLDDLRRREKRLEGFQNDPGFRSLKPEVRDWVDGRHQELAAYLAYLEKLLQERSPAAERSEEGLNAQIDRLKGPLTLPQADWAGTPAGQRRQEMLETAEAVIKGVRDARFWYQDERDRIAGEMLTDRDAAATADWAGWASRADKLLAPDRRPPFRPTDALPGIAGLTYETVLRFDRVLTARVGWEADRERLERLLKVASALGLVPPTEQRPAVLVFATDFPLTEARERLARLHRTYPDYPKTFAREGLPLAALARTIRSRYETLLTPARAEVLRQLKLAGPGTEETAKRWGAVRGWLKEPTELASWRQLALLLLRMEDPLAEDPVAALASFLNREAFDLTIDSVLVEIPNIRSIAPRAEATLDLFLSAAGRQPARSFRPSGEPRKDDDRRVTVYTFRGDGGLLRYRPGDKLWAKLPLRGGTQVLTWSDSRSEMYQFERLRRPPRLQDEGAASLTAGRLLDEARLILRPAGGVPAVPDLMPAVRLD